MDSLILRSKTVRRKKKSKETNKLIKDLSVKMASEKDIMDMVKYHKTKKAFEPQSFGGKTTENAK